jgi:hypothetical protein
VHGVTRFSDLSQDEFRKYFKGATVPLSVQTAVNAAGKSFINADIETTVSQVDWTGIYTTPIKNQGMHFQIH